MPVFLKNFMPKIIRVAILEDHQSVIDGYMYRLRDAPQIEVVLTTAYSLHLEKSLQEIKVDVLLLDIHVPISPENTSHTPILLFVKKLKHTYPEMGIIAISMHSSQSLIKAITDAGASGYILKDDHKTIRQLSWVIATVGQGGVYYSKHAHDALMSSLREEKSILTPRQIELISLLAAYPHLTSAAVAFELNVSHSTVRNLLSDIYSRLNVKNRSAAILVAQQKGLIPGQVKLPFSPE